MADDAEAAVEMLMDALGSDRASVVEALEAVQDDHGDKDWDAAELIEAVREQQVKIGIAANIRRGYLKFIGYGFDGEPRYRLTAEGKRHVEAMLGGKIHG